MSSADAGDRAGRAAGYAHGTVTHRPQPDGPVLCGVDVADECADRPLGVAAGLARMLARDLVVVHVTPPAGGAGTLAVPHGVGVAYPVPYADPEERDVLRHHALTHVEDLLARCDVHDAEVQVELGPAPADVLCDIVAERDASMLVVGSRGHGAVRAALLGSTSHALAGQASCPVLVVPPPQRDR